VPQTITEDVLVAAQSGSGDAFGVIWRELSPVVAGYLTGRGVSDPEALTSDVFLALLPRLGELTGGVSGLRTFVFSVAHARSVDDVRRRARRPDAVEFDPARHDSTAASAEQEALARVDTERVHGLLERLPADYREVLSLRVIADLDLEQTAAVMERSVGSVKQLQRRALIALRAALDAAGRVTGTVADAMTDVT
jgi:RNA polymerase sigma-70 factor (ECF subfamily)